MRARLSAGFAWPVPEHNQVGPYPTKCDHRPCTDGRQPAQHDPVTGGWSEALERHAASHTPDDATGAGAPSAAATGMSSADLFAAYKGRIRRYILSMVRDPAEAEDLTQDVFLQAHRKLGSLQDPDAVTSWLYKIATHVCYDRFRRSSRQPRLEPLNFNGSVGARSEGDCEDETSLDRVLERAEMSACVRNFLEDLSDEYRQVILLHDVEGLTNAEIAEMVGASLDAIKIRLHRARRKLQVALATGCDLSHDEHGVFVCELAAIPDTKSRPSG
jgi:RNA polymerase sigma-70 factor (ECF subfamily)